MHQQVHEAFGGSRPMLQLIEGLYASVREPALWDEQLSCIARHLGGQSIALFAAAPSIHTPHLLSIANMAPDAWEAFETYYAARNPIMAACERHFDQAATWYSHHAFSDAAFEKTEFSADFFQPNGMHYAVGMRISTPGMPVANISCQRARTDQPFDAHADLVLQTLRPHLLQALTLRRELGALQAQQSGLQAALEACDQAILAIDARCRVVLCSRPAELLLRSGAAISLSRGRLCCSAPAHHATLQHLLRAAVGLQAPASHAGNPPGIHSMLLPDGDTGHHLRITVLPHREPIAGIAHHIAALIFLSHSAHVARPRAAILSALYGLTPTEARIADLLASGLTLDDIANRLRLTRETARFYSKRILARTGIHRQVDLLRLILSLPAQSVPAQ